MRKAETTLSRKLLLLPLVPTLALGMVDLVTTIARPTCQGEAEAVILIEQPPAPPPTVAIQQPPERAPDPGCQTCAASL